MTLPADPGIRASDAEREQHVELLREHAAQGRLTIDELSERLDRAYSAVTRDQLAALVGDLPPREQRIAPQRTRDRHRPRATTRWAAFLAVNLLLIAIWALTGAGFFWPAWPLFAWGFALLRRQGSCHRRHPSRLASDRG